MELLQTQVFRAPVGARSHRPTKNGIVAASAASTTTLEFQGLEGRAYGIVAIYPIVQTGAGGTDVMATLRIAGRQTLFEDIHLSTILDFFRHRKLKYPIVIPTGHTAELILTNNAGSPATVYVMLDGYTHDSLEPFLEFSEEAHGAIGRPWFVYAKNTTIASSVVDQKVTVESGGGRALSLERFIFGAPALTDLICRVQVLPTEYVSGAPAQLLNDAMLSQMMTHPIPITRRKKLDLFVTNTDTPTRVFSMLGEAYLAE